MLLGAVINACVAGMYALSPTPYPAEIRTTGIGLAVGIGRPGAILSPMTVGALLDDGWSVSHLYLAFLMPMAGAAIAVAVVGACRGTAPATRPGDVVTRDASRLAAACRHPDSSGSL